jgi:hypothetical protein
MDIDKIKRRLNRLKGQEQKLKERHQGKELTKFTYHAGWDLGYVQGKIYELEELLDELAEQS